MPLGARFSRAVQGVRAQADQASGGRGPWPCAGARLAASALGQHQMRIKRGVAVAHRGFAQCTVMSSYGRQALLAYARHASEQVKILVNTQS